MRYRPASDHIFRLPVRLNGAHTRIFGLCPQAYLGQLLSRLTLLDKNMRMGVYCIESKIQIKPKYALYTRMIAPICDESDEILFNPDNPASESVPYFLFSEPIFL